MGGKSGAERRAEDAARRSDEATRKLNEQTEKLKKRSEKEQNKAQRLLIRSSRAAGGGFFSTDTPKAAATDSLGGSGDLG